MRVRKDREDFTFDQRVGALIKNARVDAGLSQVELALLAQTVQSAISEVERGITGITVGYLRRIAKSLGFELKITFQRADTYETT